MSPTGSFVLKEEISRGCSPKRRNLRERHLKGWRNQEKENTCQGADLTLWHGASAVKGCWEIAVAVGKSPSLGVHSAGRLGVCTPHFLLWQPLWAESQIVWDVVQLPQDTSPYPPRSMLPT